MVEPAKTFQDLIVWQRAHAFVLNVYRVTHTFPKMETYGLVSQFRRAAVSVPANIAEGFRKSSRAEKVRYLNIAQGSMEECRYYIILSRDLGYLGEGDLWEICEEIGKLLHSYRTAILTSDF